MPTDAAAADATDAATSAATDADDAAVRRARRACLVVLPVGAVLLGWSLNLPPGSTWFLPAACLTAGFWCLGAWFGGGLRWGRRGGDPRSGRRSVLAGPILLGLGMAVVFVVGALVMDRIPGLNGQVGAVIAHAETGLTPGVVLVTLLSGASEELFFRGTVYAALTRHRVLVSTLVYAVVTLATGNPMLVIAAAILGAVVGLQRQATGGVVAPILTHVAWSTGMLLGLSYFFV